MPSSPPGRSCRRAAPTRLGSAHQSPCGAACVSTGRSARSAGECVLRRNRRRRPAHRHGGTAAHRTGAHRRRHAVCVSALSLTEALAVVDRLTDEPAAAARSRGRPPAAVGPLRRRARRPTLPRPGRSAAPRATGASRRRHPAGGRRTPPPPRPLRHVRSRCRSQSPSASASTWCRADSRSDSTQLSEAIRRRHDLVARPSCSNGAMILDRLADESAWLAQRTRRPPRRRGRGRQVGGRRRLRGRSRPSAGSSAASAMRSPPADRHLSRRSDRSCRSAARPARRGQPDGWGQPAARRSALGGGSRRARRGSRLDAAALHHQTRGNAFFVTEMLAAGGTSIPELVSDAVRARAPAQCRRPPTARRLGRADESRPPAASSTRWPAVPPPTSRSAAPTACSSRPRRRPARPRRGERWSRRCRCRCGLSCTGVP